MAEISRKINLFVLHAHNLPNDDYESLFRRMAELDSSRRVVRQSGSFVGFPIFQKYEGGFFIQAVEGSEGEAPLIFNFQQGNARAEALPRGDIYAHATHMLVFPEKRRALIEYVRRGAKNNRIAATIEQIARSSLSAYKSARFEMTPKVESSFVTQIANFERIREASIRVTRPNASWTDHYTDLSDLIEKSDGNSATLDVRAGRGEALAKNKGIVGVVKDVVNDQEPYLEEATITGTRKDESAETTIRASKFIAQGQVRVQIDGNKHIAPTDMRLKLLQISENLLRQFK